MRNGNRKPLIRYRFKDDMGCVTYRLFQTDREARLWFDKNRIDLGLKELCNVCLVYKSKI